jgi:Carboxypeptidase regulatory-like domain
MTLLFLALVLLLQTPAAPPRDLAGQSVPRAGKCILRGRVLDATSGQPIKGATVTLVSQGQQEAPLAATDSDGRWEIADLPAGEYHATASKSGYANRVVFGRGIELTGARPEQTLDLTLVRGAVLSGRVTDLEGEPIAGVQVMALKEMPVGRGIRQWRAVNGGNTDDRGQFRVFGLEAGEYVLAARADGQSPMRPDSNGNRLTAVTTYYPGTAVLAEAQRLSLGEAAEYSDLVLALQVLRSVSVRGRVVVSTDRLRHGFTMLMPVGDQLEFMGMSGQAMVDPDGSFRIPGVTAGNYTLSIRVELANGEQQVGQVDISAGDEDISDVVVATYGATPITGRVVAEPAGTRLPEMLSVGAQPLGERMQFVGTQDAQVKPDGTFELKAFQSPVKLFQMGQSAGWAQSSVRWKGHDVSGGLHFEAGQRVAGVEIVVRKTTSRISGAVTGASLSAEGGNEGAVIAFRDGAEDVAGLGVSAIVPIRDGRFSLGPMLAGDYQLVAVRSPDPSFFERIELVEVLRARATVVTVADNETRTVNLTLITDY